MNGHQTAASFLSRLGLLLIWTVGLVATASAGPLDISIVDNADDGVELDDRVWNPDAAPLSLGRPGDNRVHDLGLRFLVPELIGVDEVVFARLRFSGRGGLVTDRLTYRVTGALETQSPPLSAQRRPSQLPRTATSTTATVTEDWLCSQTLQNFYYTPDLSGIVNEIIDQPGWGLVDPALIFMVDDVFPSRPYNNHVLCSQRAPLLWPVTLQVCRTLAETFEGKEILGRPTDESVTVNFVSLVDLEVVVEYGPGNLNQRTPPSIVKAGTAGEILVRGLRPGSNYSYRLGYRRPGTLDPFQYNPMRRFRTQQPPGSPFTFTIQADSHTWAYWAAAQPEEDHLALYERTLANIRLDQPDFHFALGDFSMTEYSLTYHNAWDRYACQRNYLDEILHSIPFFLVIGNHEGELGYFMAEADSVAVWAERARRVFIPNPPPGDFYDSCSDPPATGDGFRESYYAFEWGDALFVVLDPYWYTIERPFHNALPENGGGWAWTLGRKQYEWLHEVLSGSERTWKIVLSHQLVGGIENGFEAYGRGGIEAAKFSVAQKPSFEWGGENHFGFNAFSIRRPDWSHGPIHDLLLAEGVKLAIFGHDHFYAYQELDGISYVTCPQPHDRDYGYGGMDVGEYANGVLLPNSGHVRFQVWPSAIRVTYVRAFLPGEGTNRTIADIQTISLVPEGEQALSPPAGSSARVAPNPVRGLGRVVLRFTGPARGSGDSDTEVRVFDIAGRLVARVSPESDGSYVWDQRNVHGRLVPSGHYFFQSEAQGVPSTNRLVIVR